MSAINPEVDSVGIILAAGYGRRMRSRIPKPLHRAAGKELIRYPVDLLTECGVETIVVVASPDNLSAITAALGEEVQYAVQPSPDGTADAVSHGLAALGSAAGTVIVLASDTPLVRRRSLRKLLDQHRSRPGARMTILTAPDAFGPDLGHVSEPAAATPPRLVRCRP